MEKISVSIRVRPLDKQEAAKGSPWKIENNAITLCSSSGAPLQNQAYIFDNVFGMDSTTLCIYAATTRDIVDSAVKGFNGTVLVYGQTSSGKTFTMRGTQDEPGIIPRAIHDVFKNLEEAVDREFLLRMSYMEIYNEEINDLLAPEQTKLQVHESVERGIFVAGLREEIVASPEQVLQLMEFGEAHRHIGETNMNVHSSRSHTIFRMVIESRDKSQDDSLGFSCDAVRVSVLNLVDLAGSERVAKTGAEGTRLKEGTHINKSLMVLGNVINKLSEGIQNQGGHVPYRDSKLTRILQPALGGNARTAVICNITPAMVHVDESRGTLQFASRAIRVTNCAQVNEILTDAALLKRQKKEIEELRCKLKESHSEHLEEEILTLRNTLLKSECERERIALELQEEKRAHAERERKQAQKIENLSTLVLNSTVDDREFEKRSKKNARRETWCPSVTTGNVPDEDGSKSWKEEKWIAQSRDRMFPMPPPFDSLLEEEESNTKELDEAQVASPQLQESFGVNKDNGLDGEYSAVPDFNARIHVADRKRKYCPIMPTLDEDGFQEQANLSKRSIHCDDMQVADDFQILSVDLERSLNMRIEGQREEDTSTLFCVQDNQNEGNLSMKERDEDLKSLLRNLKKEKEELALQLTEAYLQFEEEKAAWAATKQSTVGEEIGSNFSMVNVNKHAERVKVLEEKLLEAENEVRAARLLAEEERLERLDKSNEVSALKQNLTELERELDVMKSSELGKELSSLEEDCECTTVCENQIDAESSPEVLEEKLTDMQKELQNVERFVEPEMRLMRPAVAPLGLSSDQEVRSMELLKKRNGELESSISHLKSEIEELSKNVQELECFKTKAEELGKEVGAANEIAEQEKIERAKMVLEIRDLQGKMNDLELMLLNERTLRGVDAEKLSDLQGKYASMEGLLGQSDIQFTKERWILKTEILKLQVSLDAMTAKAEVFHGRLLEAQDELKDAHVELDHFKGLKAKLGKEERIMVVDTSEKEMCYESVYVAGLDQFVKPRHLGVDDSGCTTDPNSIWQLAACNMARKAIEHSQNNRTHLNDEGQVEHGTVGFQCKSDEARIASSRNVAHTVSLPMRSMAVKRQDVKGTNTDVERQSRPLLQTLSKNTTAGNRISKEILASGKNSATQNPFLSSRYSSLKPPKFSLPHRSSVHAKAWPNSSYNKENR